MGNASDWPIEALWPNPDNPRHGIKDDPGFEGLVQSVKSQGIIQPILITDDGMILAGHRRYEAAMVVGLLRVPVRVLNDDSNHVLVPLIENLQRSDLTALEVAEYLRAYQREHNPSLVEISEATGISSSTISKYLKLADAPVELKERIQRDEIPLGAAFELLRHDEEFIREVIKTPTLTKQIVRARAAEAGADPIRSARQIERGFSRCPNEPVAHLEYAVAVISELLGASPDEAYSVRYRRWINILSDDLADAREPTSTFRGAIDAFQRQPQQGRGWKAG